MIDDELSSIVNSHQIEKSRLIEKLNLQEREIIEKTHIIEKIENKDDKVIRNID